MLQRIQSVYLGLAASLFALLFIFPIGSLVIDNIVYQVFVFGTNKISDSTVEHISKNVIGSIFTLVIFFSVIVTIFQFKKRSLQIKLCSLNVLLITAFLAFEYLSVESFKKIYETGIYKNELGGVFSLIALIFIFLAQRGIKKDDELVRSADRLR